MAWLDRARGGPGDAAADDDLAFDTFLRTDWDGDALAASGPAFLRRARALYGRTGHRFARPSGDDDLDSLVDDLVPHILNAVRKVRYGVPAAFFRVDQSAALVASVSRAVQDNAALGDLGQRWLADTAAAFFVYAGAAIDLHLATADPVAVLALHYVRQTMRLIYSAVHDTGSAVHAAARGWRPPTRFDFPVGSDGDDDDVEAPTGLLAALLDATNAGAGRIVAADEIDALVRRMERAGNPTLRERTRSWTEQAEVGRVDPLGPLELAELRRGEMVPVAAAVPAPAIGQRRRRTTTAEEKPKPPPKAKPTRKRVLRSSPPPEQPAPPEERPSARITASETKVEEIAAKPVLHVPYQHCAAPLVVNLAGTLLKGAIMGRVGAMQQWDANNDGVRDMPAVSAAEAASGDIAAARAERRNAETVEGLVEAFLAVVSMGTLVNFLGNPDLQSGMSYGDLVTSAFQTITGTNTRFTKSMGQTADTRWKLLLLALTTPTGTPSEATWGRYGLKAAGYALKSIPLALSHELAEGQVATAVARERFAMMNLLREDASQRIFTWEELSANLGQELEDNVSPRTVTTRYSLRDEVFFGDASPGEAWDAGGQYWSFGGDAAGSFHIPVERLGDEMTLGALGAAATVTGYAVRGTTTRVAIAPGDASPNPIWYGTSTAGTAAVRGEAAAKGATATLDKVGAWVSAAKAQAALHEPAFLDERRPVQPDDDFWLVYENALDPETRAGLQDIFGNITEVRKSGAYNGLIYVQAHSPLWAWFGTHIATKLVDPQARSSWSGLLGKALKLPFVDAVIRFIHYQFGFLTASSLVLMDFAGTLLTTLFSQASALFSEGFFYKLTPFAAGTVVAELTFVFAKLMAERFGAPGAGGARAWQLVWRYLPYAHAAQLALQFGPLLVSVLTWQVGAVAFGAAVGLTCLRDVIPVLQASVSPRLGVLARLWGPLRSAVGASALTYFYVWGGSWTELVGAAGTLFSKAPVPLAAASARPGRRPLARGYSETTARGADAELLTLMAQLFGDEGNFDSFTSENVWGDARGPATTLHAHAPTLADVPVDAQVGLGEDALLEVWHREGSVPKLHAALQPATLAEHLAAIDEHGLARQLALEWPLSLTAAEKRMLEEQLS